MKARMFKNSYLLMTDRDEGNLSRLLLDPMHKEIKDDLSKVIETDSAGMINFFMPISNMQWSLIFYIQNLMIMQRMYEVDLLKKEVASIKKQLKAVVRSNDV